MARRYPDYARTQRSVKGRKREDAEYIALRRIDKRSAVTFELERQIWFKRDFGRTVITLHASNARRERTKT
jgi:hypothetical protein